MGSSLEALDGLDKFLDVEESELNLFVKRNSLKEHPSAHRAFKFGLKFVFLNVKTNEIDNASGEFKIQSVTNSYDFLEMFKMHLPLFIAFDMVEVPQTWIMMNMTQPAVYLLIKSNQRGTLSASVDLFTEARELAKEKGDWGGKLFYKIIDAGGQNEI